jgi:hypothetical protein
LRARLLKFHNPTKRFFAMKLTSQIIALSVLINISAHALDYPYATGEPQKTGWPLTDEEKAYVLKPEHERRPGSEAHKHLPTMWPVTPSAGNWGGTSWLDMHAKLVKDAQAARGPIDVLLVGDSITMQWGAAWTKHFPTLKTVNIGIGGDKTQPKVVAVLIGNNNMFFTAETGIEAAANGVKMVVANVREKFPKAEVISVNIFPAHTPGVPFYEDIKKTNAALNALKLDNDPKVHRLDLTAEMLNPDGTLKAGIFSKDNIHLTQDGGCELYASRLKPIIEALLRK